MKNEIKKLQRKNELLRGDIDEIIGINHPLYSPIWVLINKLIENEIQQEEFCNQ